MGTKLRQHSFRPHRWYNLSFEFRASSAAAVVPVFVCEKTLLYAFRCFLNRVRPMNPSQWESYRLSFESRSLGQGRLFDRPVELAVGSAPGGKASLVEW